MKKLSDSLKIRNTVIKNRICVPPLVIFNKDGGNTPIPETYERYRSFAKGGTGLVIHEATCVSPDGLLGYGQLGIWCDEQIEGLKKTADIIHENGATSFIQIHHAGVTGTNPDPVCPSAYSFEGRNGTVKGHEATIEEIEKIIEDFIDGAVRAEKAGFDGIEIHGCHSYLVSQFLNNRVNKRTDEYAGGLLFVKKIIDGVRAKTSPDFIFGVRLGAFEPTLEDGIKNAKTLEEMGVDFLDISYGFDREHEPFCPVDFPYKDIVWAAGEIKKNVNVPVFAVNSITTPEEAKGILEITDVDMVDIGRSMLIDPDWANKALRGEKTGRCLKCKNCLMFSPTPDACPGIKLFRRENQI